MRTTPASQKKTTSSWLGGAIDGLSVKRAVVSGPETCHPAHVSRLSADTSRAREVTVRSGTYAPMENQAVQYCTDRVVDAWLSEKGRRHSEPRCSPDVGKFTAHGNMPRFSRLVY
jgi:hypothetical protein